MTAQSGVAEREEWEHRSVIGGDKGRNEREDHIFPEGKTTSNSASCCFTLTVGILQNT